MITIYKYLIIKPSLAIISHYSIYHALSIYQIDANIAQGPLWEKPPSMSTRRTLNKPFSKLEMNIVYKLQQNMQETTQPVRQVGILPVQDIHIFKTICRNRCSSYFTIGLIVIVVISGGHSSMVSHLHCGFVVAGYELWKSMDTNHKISPW